MFRLFGHRQVFNIGCTAHLLCWSMFPVSVFYDLLDISGRNSTIYVLVKMLNIKIYRLLEILKYC
jgi:hypothetical protein